jgi:methylaspartate mutase epsilon subunit
MEVVNKMLDEDEFFREREKVLAMWPTGKEVDLDEAIEFHKSMPPTKNYAKKLAEAKRKGIILIRSDAGYTTIEQNKDLLLYLQNEGHTDFLHTQLDSLTRTLQFEAAERALRDSEKTGKNLLNGFPVVVHGVAGTRKIVDAVDLPLELRAPCVDFRLATEIVFTAGYTSNLMSALVSFETYTKTASFETVVHNHQYNSRLAGYYQERGVPIHVDLAGGAGAIVCGVCPTSLATAGTVISALMTAEQGPKYISVYCIMQGNLVQDIATSINHIKLAREYLDRFGYEDVEVFLINGCIAGQYPLDHAQAFAEVLYAPIVSVLSKANICHIKTLDEADTIPAKENHAISLRGTRMVVNLLKDQNIDMLSNKAVRAEAEQDEREARAIIDRVLDFGDGDIIVGTKRAYEQGVLDSVFHNNPLIMGKVMGIRDAQGAVRYLNHGNLPFSKDMLEFHRQKIAVREKVIGKELDYDTVVSDLLAISRGSLLPTICK